MKAIRLFVAALVFGIVGVAGASEKPPAWAVGKFMGVDPEMKAQMGVSVAANGIVFATTIEKNGKQNRFSGRFHHNSLIIGKKVYALEKAPDGIKLINQWRPADRLTMKKMGSN